MDFTALVLFLCMYYLRPQEWYGFLAILHPIQVLSLLSLYSLLSRERSIRLRDLFQTPHDWMVFAYFAWSVFASPTPWETFKSIQSVILFYIVGVQALSSVQRMKTFIGWWAALIFIISLLAIGSEYGFDPLGSYDKTHGVMKDRLILNLSIFNNPNALGHSLVPVIPMMLILLFWKRVFMKPAIAILLLPLWCIYLTQSKGAFLSTFVTTLASLMFGRPKTVQIVIGVLALASGGAMLSQLPRMTELKKAQGDAAIKGRLAAFQFGLDSMRSHFFGLGLSTFQREFFKHGPMEYIPTKVIRKDGLGNEQLKIVMKPRHYMKATHSSYNQNGAELGYIGLYLFVGILYCCFRTLMSANTSTLDEERVRRALFSVVVSYAVSSWMVDFCYRPTFFLFVATAGAFHRHLLGLNKKNAPEETGEASWIPAWRPMPHPVASEIVLAKTVFPKIALETHGTFASPAALPMSEAEENQEKGTSVMLNWKRIGVVDLAITAVLTWGVIKYWAYIIHKI